MSTLQSSVSAIREALAAAGQNLVEREALVESIALAAIAGEHLLVIGPPGTAKSEAVRRVAKATNGRYFEYLLGRFTEPSEVFGPIDLRKLKEGLVETETNRMLPEAEIAFLDEVFQGSTAILNTLLGVLNERVFRRGHTQLNCPLRVCVAASNTLPTDESLAAFADRFLVRAFVEPIPDPRIEELLEAGWQLSGNGNHPQTGHSATVQDIDALAATARQTDMSLVRPLLAQALRMLRSDGVMLSDRRAVKSQRLIAAAAVLAGRERPTEADLWPLILAIPTREEQSVARECLRDMLVHTANETLPAVAEEMSLGPKARATRIVVAGRKILSEYEAQADRESDHALRLKLEGIAREIDAGFSPEQMPPELTDLRVNIVQALKREMH